jgi:hypothetical protein
VQIRQNGKNNKFVDFFLGLDEQMIWTPERIATLSSQEVKDLASNASDRGRSDVAEMCQKELEARKPKPSPKFQLPEGFSKIVRNAVSKKLESDADDLLIALANELLPAYDLSAKRAIERSEGTKGFKAHELLSGKGISKYGRAQTIGLVAFDRFISYRLKDEAYALLCLLTDSSESAGVQYHVFGPQRLLDRFVPLEELRPYPMNQISIGIYTGGEAFATFKEAAERFRWLIDQVAEKRT